MRQRRSALVDLPTTRHLNSTRLNTGLLRNLLGQAQSPLPGSQASRTIPPSLEINSSNAVAGVRQSWQAASGDHDLQDQTFRGTGAEVNYHYAVRSRGNRAVGILPIFGLWCINGRSPEDPAASRG